MSWPKHGNLIFPGSELAALPQHKPDNNKNNDGAHTAAT